MPVHIGAQIPFLIVTYAAIGKYAWQYTLTSIFIMLSFVHYLLLQPFLYETSLNCLRAHDFNCG